MTTHKLKTWPEYFSKVISGDKTFEVRKNDRDFNIGDILELEEYCPIVEKYTGAITSVRVSHILKGGKFGIEKGFVVMSIKPLFQMNSQTVNIETNFGEIKM